MLVLHASSPSWLTLPIPVKNLCHSSGELSFLAGLHVCCHRSLLGELNIVHVTPLGEDNCKLMAGFSWTVSCLAFFLADFNLYPLTVINGNCEFLSFTGPSNEESNLSRSLGKSWHKWSSRESADPEARSP